MLSDLLLVYCLGVYWVLLQFGAAWLDKYGTQAQLKARGIFAFSFWEHGGMWADISTVPLAIAYILSKHRFEVFNLQGVLTGIVIVAAILALVEFFRRVSKVLPEAHAHDGVTTLAGWLHASYAVVAIWVGAMFYLAPASPRVTVSDVIVVTILLTPVCILGVMKFNPRWNWKKADIATTIGELVLIWGAAIVRIATL